MKDKYVIIPLLLTLMLVYASVVYLWPRAKLLENPISNPSYVYDEYLSSYERRGFQLLAVQVKKWHSLSGTEVEWKVYLYNPNGTLVYVRIGTHGVSKREYSTAIDYSPITMPLDVLRESPPDLKKHEYIDRIYFLNSTNYRIMKDEYHGISRCRNLTSLLSGKMFKLVRGIKTGSETSLVNLSHVGGVFVLTGSYSYRPLCRETWVVVQPYNKTHDRVGVIYADADVWGFVPKLDLPVFNGTHYAWLIKRYSKRLSWGDVEGLLMNATGIYLNPHAREIFKRSYKRTDLPDISQVTILRNGTVKTWGIWIERGRARNPP